MPDSVGGVFSWGRPVPLVSVSEDGKQLPSVFVFADVLGMQYKNISYIPSPVIEIDGIEATKFLEGLSYFAPVQDRDAAYNDLFYGLAQVKLSTDGAVAGMFTGGGRGRFVYPGATTTLKFANGSEYTMHNHATVLKRDFYNVTSGETLAANKFGWGGVDAEMQMQSTRPIPRAAAAFKSRITAPGYPAPVLSDASTLINGFYIDRPGYEDVAVLSVPTFIGRSSKDFQALSQNFISKALAAGKTKLIIDLQANGGGLVALGYDLFKQLFPNIDPHLVDRIRATEAAGLIGQSFSTYASQFAREPTTNSSIKGSTV